MKHKHSKTRLYGKRWEQLIKLNNLRVGDMLVFSMTGPNPKISVFIMDFGKNAEETDEISSDDNSDEDSESEEEDSYIVAQRVHLKNHEKYGLAPLLPQRANYVVSLHAQELPKTIAEEAGLPTKGNAGLRLGTAGVVTTITYTKKTDDRIFFGKLGWKNFLEGKNFKVDQPVLIILRKPNDLSLEVIIEMQII